MAAMIRALDPALCDDGFLSVAACAKQMRTTIERVKWLANVGVLSWRRGWGDDIEIEPAVLRP